MYYSLDQHFFKGNLGRFEGAQNDYCGLEYFGVKPVTTFDRNDSKLVGYIGRSD